jgi:hypothetical protein
MWIDEFQIHFTPDPRSQLTWPAAKVFVGVLFGALDVYWEFAMHSRPSS